MNTLYLDCFCGISGDMTVGALIDAGADLAFLTSVADSLALTGVEIRADRVMKHGIQATRFQVLTDPAVEQPHRHLSDILDLIQKTALDAAAKNDAIGAFEHLGRAEAEVHGVPVEKIHFHEVGAIDSILDIVLANAALHALDIDEVVCSPLVAGSGVVSCDHGIMPVPAPATALLLRGIPWSAGDVQRELVTPTGAALVKQWARAFGTMPPMTSRTVGYGAGSRDLLDRANVLRVFTGTREHGMAATDTVMVLETTIDDLNPEITATLIPVLMEGGARDACIYPVLAKKGRMAQHVVVLADRAKASGLARLIFAHGATLGIRVREEQRWVLEREIRHVATPWGPVRVKVGLLGGEKNCASPEFEDCRALAEAHMLPVRTVYESALVAAVKGEFTDE